MRKSDKIQGLTIVFILLIATGSAKPTDPEKTDSNDEIGKKIEEKGKTIDEISSSIEKSTDGMEGEIEKAGKGIDSPEAEKRLEIAGEGIDELSDKMDREIEEKGREIEDEAKTRESDDENKPSTSTKSESIADKHQSLPKEPLAKTFIRHAGDFDKQEALRKRMEDAVDIEGDRVEEIGNGMGSKRNLIQHTSSITQQDKTQTRTHWSKNRKQKRRKEIGGNIKIHKNRIKKRKLVNRNASKRRVIVPVKRKKLEKMMLYYYIVEKMKNGELLAHNLEKFFEKLDGYSESTAEPKVQPEKTAGLNGLLKMIGTNVKSDSDVSSNNEVTTNLNSFIEKINRNSETDTSSGATEEKDTVDMKNPDLDSFVQLLHKKLRSDNADSEKEQEKAAPKKADLKSLVKSLMGDNGATKTEDESSPIGTSNDDAEDAAKLKDMDVQKATAQISNPSSGSELTDKQVKKMLQSISEINATLLDHGKKRKHKTWHKPKKTCTGDSCAGRDIISLLDKALHEVQKEKKTADGPKSSEARKGKEEIKMTGEARSKSDPYAGIGFTTNQESGRNNDASEGESQSSKPVSGESRHIESHGADIGGTSQPAVQRMMHGHHDDDDDDDEDDEEDDDFHDGDTVHGYHYPLPMHQEQHHVHHHMHHREHEHEPYEHHGYHGNQLPIRVSNHHEHEDFGYTAPLNVDTAPMHHYPDRHMHDHLDVDSMLRGHPYPHHQHTPEVSLEGPISLAPVYEDMHHMLNGPGIHDQTDVHYEVEMHAHPDHHEEEGHHDDYDHHDEGHHDDYHHTGYRHEVGYHHADNEDHDQDEHHDNGYHEDYHGDDDHEHGENGDKKHFITPGNKKSNWQAKKTKNTDSKKQTLKESGKKPKRFRREEDDDDDDEQHQDQIENIPRNGYGVSRLSYLTEQNGNTMEHEIGDRILDVEDVGRSIEEKVQHGVDRVTKLSNSDVEAPDYDSQGNMEHNIHREDIEEDGE